MPTFRADPDFPAQLSALGIAPEDVLVLVRPPARDALYHRFENELFTGLLERLGAQAQVTVLLLPRNEEQRATYGQRATGKFIIPGQPLDGPNLIAASDLVVSAGGTMNREAAALGVPAATIYAGAWAALDEELVREGRLRRIASREDLEGLPLEKKGAATLRRKTNVRREVTDLILEI